MSLTHFRVAILSIFLFSFINSGTAQVGTLNKDFGNEGYVDVNLIDTIYTGIFSDTRSTTDANGNIYLSGIFDGKKLLVHKLMPNGKPDLTFGNKGYLAILNKLDQGDFGQTLLVQIDSYENLYLVRSIGLNNQSICKYNRFGQADLSFGTNGEFVLPLDAPYVANFVIDGNNNFYYTSNSVGNYVVKFNQNGILDNTFGTNGVSQLRFGPSSVVGFPTIDDLLIDTDGYLYLSAFYINSGALVKLNPDGSFANSFGNQGVVKLSTPYSPKEILFDSEERICLLENAGSNQALVLRYFTSGLPDFSFGQNGIFDITLPDYTSIYFNDMHLDIHDNIFVAGGGLISTTSNTECLIVKINTISMNFDPSFHSDGIMNFVSNNDMLGIYNIVMNANGIIFASGASNFNYGSFLETTIIDANANIIGSFTNQKENVNSSDNILDLGLNVRGDLYLCGAIGHSQNNYPSLASLTSEGILNQNFGTNGKKIYLENINTTQDFIAIEKNGNIYAAGTVPNADPTLVKSFITKTDAHGNRINNFGINGTLFYASNPNFSRNTFEFLFDQDSSLLMFANHNDLSSILITKITRSGNIDLSYGNQGSVLITNAASLYGMKAVIDNNGNIYIAGHAGTNDVFITKVTNQTIDPLFGINGFSFRTFPSYPGCSAVSFDSNNNLVISCYYLSNFPVNYRAFLYKLTSRGELIPAFGSSGTLTLTYTNVAPQDLIVDKNDNIFLFASSYGENYTVVKVNALGTVDVSFGSNGLLRLALGSYRGVTYDKGKGVAYLYGSNYNGYNNNSNVNTDIRIFCLQIEKTNFNTISGTVFKDADASCDKQATEQGIRTISIIAQPGNNYSMTDALGTYELKVDTGAYPYTVKQLLNPIQQQLYVNTCNAQHSISLAGSGKMVSNIDFADKLNPITCPLLYVDVQNTVRRRCYGGLTKIRYANYGTASESNVTIVVTYPEHNIPKKSTPAWQSQSNKILTYNIGTLNPGQEGFITIADSISCLSESILGLTQCIKVEITPVRNCVVAPMWDHSDIKITQLCRADSSVFFIKNIGAGDMNTARNFNVFVNDTIIYSSRFLLESNSAVSISYPANGKSIRVSAEQHEDFPFPSDPSLSTQSCNATTIVNPVRTPLTNLPLDDRSFFIAYTCLPIVGSFDPNHKSVTPSGYGTENYINKNHKLNYTIQFQNVGTDTAFKVVIIDTLDTDLNIETLLIESSSHPFTHTLSGRGYAVLKFTFDPIILTDSTSNLKKSEGFISYSIYPKEGLWEGTTLSNKAYIYFDYNSPIITNETLLTIRDDYQQDLSKGSAVSVRTGIVSANRIASTKNISVYPNPAKDQLQIKSTHLNLKTIQFVTITGSIVLTEKLSGTESIIKINTLTPGIYFYTILDEFENSSQGKIIIE